MVSNFNSPENNCKKRRVHVKVKYVKIYEWDMCRVGAMIVHIRPGEFGHFCTLLGNFHINIEPGMLPFRALDTEISLDLGILVLLYNCWNHPFGFQVKLQITLQGSRSICDDLFKLHVSCFRVHFGFSSGPHWVPCQFSSDFIRKNSYTVWFPGEKTSTPHRSIVPQWTLGMLCSSTISGVTFLDFPTEMGWGSRMRFQ